ncbi:MAG: MBL fold metallo-hydrolase [Opitutaceae bacterium]|jgi:phosphoribosyl 1,2-cyclic phosphodiesterase
MKLISLASGSKGNALYLGTSEVSLLFDVGLRMRELRTRMAEIGKTPELLDGFLCTHEHNDHACGASDLFHKLKVPMLVTPAGNPLIIRGVEIRSFPVPHDAKEPVGFKVRVGEHKIGIVLDSGQVWDTTVEMLKDVETLVIECNHDPGMVWLSDRPESLKERILGPLGHLSNDACGSAIVRIAQGGKLKRVALAHLSRECNNSSWARTVIGTWLAGSKLNLDVTVLEQTEVKEIYAD